MAVDTVSVEQSIWYEVVNFPVAALKLPPSRSRIWRVSSSFRLMVLPPQTICSVRWLIPLPRTRRSLTLPVFLIYARTVARSPSVLRMKSQTVRKFIESGFTRVDRLADDTKFPRRTCFFGGTVRLLCGQGREEREDGEKKKEKLGSRRAVFSRAAEKGSAETLRENRDVHRDTLPRKSNCRESPYKKGGGADHLPTPVGSSAGVPQ